MPLLRIYFDNSIFQEMWVSSTESASSRSTLARNWPTAQLTIWEKFTSFISPSGVLAAQVYDEKCEHFRSFMRHALLHLRTETLSRKFFGKWVFRPRRVCNLAGFHASLRKTTHNTLSWLYPPPSKIVLRQTFWSALHFRISASSRSWHIFPLAASGKQE